MHQTLTQTATRIERSSEPELSSSEKNVVKSAGRVFEVLELFHVQRQAMTATAVARTLGYPGSSTVALLKSMVALGYLSYEPQEHTYFPTIQLAVISRWLEDSFYVDGHLLELVDDIAAATGETVVLWWHTDLHLRFARVSATNREFTVPDLGSRFPLFHSVPGLTALTLRRDPDIARLAERCNAMAAEGEPPVELDAAMNVVRQYRTLGYGIGFDLVQPGLSNIAWALRPSRSSQSIVVSIMGPTDRLKNDSEAMVRAARSALSRYTDQH
jgi:DNA-binding IclR family transcriptional regulator